jgi:hypothetical protein
MTVAGNTVTLTDSGVTYSGRVERTGGTFRMEDTTAEGIAFVLEGRIDDTGHVTGSISVSGEGQTCKVPITGQRD